MRHALNLIAIYILIFFTVDFLTLVLIKNTVTVTIYVVIRNTTDWFIKSGVCSAQVKDVWKSEGQEATSGELLRAGQNSAKSKERVVSEG